MSTAPTASAAGSASTSVRDRKIAIITGANRGLGRDTALRLAEAGTDLIITYRSHGEEAAAVVDELTALGSTAHALRLDTAEVSGFAALLVFTATPGSDSHEKLRLLSVTGDRSPVL
jgi:NAD(P)-dependent dehydrogenase (short-subunit alcohol dehydrogenase family)